MTRGDPSVSHREGVPYPKVRKTGPLPLCLSLDTEQENVETTLEVVDKS